MIMAIELKFRSEILLILGFVKMTTLTAIGTCVIQGTTLRFARTIKKELWRIYSEERQQPRSKSER